ncbi:MAG: hypothetical protein ACLUE8_05595 [Lachnospiraceae bacterium]
MENGQGGGDSIPPYAPWPEAERRRQSRSLSSAYGGSASCRVYVDGKLYLEQSVTME